MFYFPSKVLRTNNFTKTRKERWWSLIRFCVLGMDIMEILGFKVVVCALTSSSSTSMVVTNLSCRQQLQFPRSFSVMRHQNLSNRWLWRFSWAAKIRKTKNLTSCSQFCILVRVLLKPCWLLTSICERIYQYVWLSIRVTFVFMCLFMINYVTKLAHTRLANVNPVSLTWL